WQRCLMRDAVWLRHRNTHRGHDARLSRGGGMALAPSRPRVDETGDLANGQFGLSSGALHDRVASDRSAKVNAECVQARSRPTLFLPQPFPSMFLGCRVRRTGTFWAFYR